MDDNIEFPDRRGSDRTTITDGFFEREVRLSREETAAFLHDLADQISAESRLTISTDEWEIPFTYRDPIEVEVEFTSGNEKELEIEVEFSEPRDGDGLNVD